MTHIAQIRGTSLGAAMRRDMPHGTAERAITLRCNCEPCVTARRAYRKKKVGYGELVPARRAIHRSSSDRYPARP